MQLQNKVLMTLGIFAAMAMPLQAAQPAQPSAATQDASQRTVQQKSPKSKRMVAEPGKARSMQKQSELSSPTAIQQVSPKLRRQPDLQLAPGQFERPVITEPVSNSDTCCMSGRRWSGDNLKIETEFDVAGTGLPGHRIKVWAYFHNDGSKSLIKSSSATVGADGRWKARFFKLTSPDSAASAFIEITATQYFDPTRVREPEGEGHAVPVILKYRAPPSRPNGGAAASTGG